MMDGDNDSDSDDDNSIDPELARQKFTELREQYLNLINTKTHDVTFLSTDSVHHFAHIVNQIIKLFRY